MLSSILRLASLGPNSNLINPLAVAEWSARHLATPLENPTVPRREIQRLLTGTCQRRVLVKATGPLATGLDSALQLRQGGCLRHRF